MGIESKVRNIFWRPDCKKNKEGLTFANVHLLAGYNQVSLTDLRIMADELKETFPQATDDVIRTGRITNSKRVKGFTIITWQAHIPAGEYPGWNQHPSGIMEYSW